MATGELERRWLEAKVRAWERLWEDLEIGYLDEEMLPIILEFFARPSSFTLSSCAGRVTLVEGRAPWGKGAEARILWKRHGPIDAETIREYASRTTGRLWLVATGPIVHVVARDLSEAAEVLRIAREAGYKHSGIISPTWEGGVGVVVELVTGIHVSMLVAEDGRLLVDAEAAARLAGEVVIEAAERRARLLNALRAARPPRLWGPAEAKLRELGLL